jgi:Putative undecaprenyl diphosphate synthase
MLASRHGLRRLLNFVFGVLQRLLLWIIASGPLPNHIAFVMDGNRRYAGRKGKPVTEGHYAGYSALYRVIRILFVLLHLATYPRTPLFRCSRSASACTSAL